MENSFSYRERFIRIYGNAFGLTNAPASFQEMMNEIFERQEGILWYLDDILIHGGNTEEEHQKVVEQMLKKCLGYKNQS